MSFGGFGGAANGKRRCIRAVRRVTCRRRSRRRIAVRGNPARAARRASTACSTQEPDHGEPTARFTYRSDDDETGTRLTLRGLIFRHWHVGAAAALLVAIVSVTNQAGPKLIDIGIDNGMTGAHKSFAVVAAGRGTVSHRDRDHRACPARPGKGDRKARGAGDERPAGSRVHVTFSSSGLDYYTDEQSGVIMTRMTSDIENLQQLLQDGLAQLAVQGLTMVVITIILFTMDVKLTLITIALIVPALTVGFALVQGGVGARVRPRPRPDRERAGRSVREPARGPHVARQQSPASSTSSSTATSSASTATPITTPPRSMRSTAPGRRCSATSARPRCWRSAVNMVVEHELSIGALVAFFLYLNRFFAPIQLLVAQYNTFQQGTASISKLRTLFAVRPSTPEALARRSCRRSRVRSPSTT